MCTELSTKDTIRQLNLVVYYSRMLKKLKMIKERFYRGFILYRFIAIVFNPIVTVDSFITDVYNFPFMGTLQYDVGDNSTVVYGSATILHASLVAVAAENLLQPNPSKGVKFICLEKKNLIVVAGSDIMKPPGYLQNIQTVRVADIYLGKNSSFMNKVNCSTPTCNYNDLSFTSFASVVIKNPTSSKNLKPPAVITNPFTNLQWDIALLTLENNFNFSPTVLPVVFHSGKPEISFFRIWETIIKLEANPHNFPHCTVPSWSPTGANEIIYHKVVYVRMKDCEDAICGEYPGSCLRYFNIRHHICFKALSFVDTCFIDQGAAVFCSWNDEVNALGILVKSFECGLRSLPSVFTAIHAIEAFGKLANLIDDQIVDPTLDDPKFTEAPL